MNIRNDQRPFVLRVGRGFVGIDQVQVKAAGETAGNISEYFPRMHDIGRLAAP